MKFLDHITSVADIGHDPVIIQGPDDRYPTWPEVEKRYINSVIRDEEDALVKNEQNGEAKNGVSVEKSLDNITEKLDTELKLVSEDTKTSPISTPPLSPSASEPQSTKTSPEIRCATVTKHDATPVPPVLKALINFVVWYTYESKEGSHDMSLSFLTNSADAAQIAKDFGIAPKTIHQLRAHILSVVGEVKQQEIPRAKKGSTRSLKSKSEAEPKTLFRYDEETSEEEEVIFKPRTRDYSRSGSFSRSNTNGNFRNRGALHSPSNSVNTPTIPKPQVPVEEIDPDSFDRGTFARGSTPLVNVGITGSGFQNNNSGNSNFGRGNQRGGYNSSTQRGGGHRGNSYRNRGRGRLFVP